MAECGKVVNNDSEDVIHHQSPKKQIDKATQKSDSDNAEADEIVSVNTDDDSRTSCRTTDGDRRKFRTLTFCRRHKSKTKESVKKRKGPWSFKLNCCRLRKNLDTADIPEPTASCETCVCTGYRRTEEHHLGAGIVFETTPPLERRALAETFGRNYPRFTRSSSADGKCLLPAVDLTRFNAKEYPTEDCDERARAERAREIEEGIDPPPGYRPTSQEIYGTSNLQLAHLASVFHCRLSLNLLPRPSLTPYNLVDNHLVETEPLIALFDGPYSRVVHTQVDYIHCLVPDLLAIANCQFYWGKMDRYEAEKLLEDRPEGTFLLRDSAQEEYLFSVSFRRYGRTLHARIEQWNHRFSFDSHDPAVYSSETVCDLIEHYKDPNCCMFFEPMLTVPLHRTSTFALQHLCRVAICNNVTYDDINRLHLPKPLKTYLKEYHYKQRVRVRRFDMEQ